MNFHIRRLFLWPASSNHEVRVLTFPPDKVGVITGWSSTGKSAVIPIIDYVLGSGSCSIPLGPIRDFVSWYGLEIATDGGLIRVARRRPDSRHVSDEYMLMADADAADDIKAAPQKNATTDTFKDAMNQLAHLSDLRLSPGDEPTGWNERASFRDMAAFTFLPQHIVANPYTLFFKADSTQHREKLKRVIPVALGIVTNEYLVRQHRADLLRNAIRELEQQERRRLLELESWRASAFAQYVRAQELGLLPRKEPPSDLQSINRELATVVARGARATVPDGLTKEAISRLQQVRNEERTLDRQVADLRRRLKRLRTVSTSFAQYEDVLSEQQGLVAGVGWFRRRITGAHECPVCGSHSDAASQALLELKTPLTELEDLAAAARHDRPMVDRDTVSTERSLYEQERRLMQTRQLRIELESSSSKGGQRLEDVYRFIGSVEHALKSAGVLGGTNEVRDQIVKLTVELREVTLGLDDKGRKDRETDALDKIGTLIADYAHFFGVEEFGAKPTLDARELTVRFDGIDGDRSAFLWEIGSGANWMGYHIAVFLAVHDYLYRLVHRTPVPTFLIIDQPSQVFFPSDTYERETSRREKSERTSDDVPIRDVDSDLRRTKQIFETVARAFRKLGGHVQIVVLEHADEAAWGHLPEFGLIADWHRTTDALIPPDWLI